jgi:dTDP-4-dehydrorhamnose reductase
MKQLKNVALTGSTGVLGTYIQSEAQRRDLGLTIVDRSMLNLRKPDELRNFLQQKECSVLINCAADTDTEGSEHNPERAFLVNVEMPDTLAKICRELDVKLVHFSSTGSYGAYKDDPYTEYDEVHPTTVSHRSKHLGEMAVQSGMRDFICLRLGWLFGGTKDNKKNFVFNRIKEAKDAEEIVSDPFQVGNPTFAKDVAERVYELLETGFSGVANCVSEGAVTRYEYVKQIIRASGLPCSVERSTEPFIRKAPVSQNESAINLRMRILGYEDMPPWCSSLKKFTKEMVAEL